jgi:PHD/YefM family antitoxin component YafN of YafNO toxin-antitoxin module
MIAIQKKIVFDEHGEPQEVIIPWAQFCELSETLDLDETERAHLREALDDSRARRCEAFTPLDEL